MLLYRQREEEIKNPKKEEIQMRTMNTEELIPEMSEGRH